MEKVKIYKKILELQKYLAIIPKKGKTNGYDYVRGDDLFAKARPKMDDLGLMLFHEVIDTTHEHVLWKTKYGEKQQTFTEVKMLFTWVDADSGETIEHQFSASGFNDWDKALGSALTYAERYYVLKQFHIPTGEDDPDARKEPEEKPNTGWKPKSKQEQLRDDFTGKNVGWTALLAKYNVKKISDLSDAQCDEIRKELG